MADRYRRRPVEVEAMQFQGWTNAVEIQQWMPGVVYIPRGHDHHLRSSHEKDRSRGDVLQDARPYLVVPTLTGEERLDINGWIVQDAPGIDPECLTSDEFEERYERVESNR